jgi:hypothetical protein
MIEKFQRMTTNPNPTPRIVAKMSPKNPNNYAIFMLGFRQDSSR